NHCPCTSPSMYAALQITWMRGTTVFIVTSRVTVVTSHDPTRCYANAHSTVAKSASVPFLVQLGHSSTVALTSPTHSHREQATFTCAASGIEVAMLGEHH